MARRNLRPISIARVPVISLPAGARRDADAGTDIDSDAQQQRADAAAGINQTDYTTTTNVTAPHAPDQDKDEMSAVSDPDMQAALGNLLQAHAKKSSDLFRLFDRVYQLHLRQSGLFPLGRIDSIIDPAVAAALAYQLEQAFGSKAAKILHSLTQKPDGRNKRRHSFDWNLSRLDVLGIFGHTAGQSFLDALNRCLKAGIEVEELLPRILKAAKSRVRETQKKGGRHAHRNVQLWRKSDVQAAVTEVKGTHTASVSEGVDVQGAALDDTDNETVGELRDDDGDDNKNENDDDDDNDDDANTDMDVSTPSSPEVEVGRAIYAPGKRLLEDSFHDEGLERPAAKRILRDRIPDTPPSLASSPLETCGPEPTWNMLNSPEGHSSTEGLLRHTGQQLSLTEDLSLPSPTSIRSSLSDLRETSKEADLAYVSETLSRRVLHAAGLTTPKRSCGLSKVEQSKSSSLSAYQTAAWEAYNNENVAPLADESALSKTREDESAPTADKTSNSKTEDEEFPALSVCHGAQSSIQGAKFARQSKTSLADITPPETKCLLPDQWMGTECIDFLCRLLARPLYHVVDSTEASPFEPTRLYSMLRDVDVSKLPLMVLPINLHGNHYAIGYMDPETRTCTIFDSYQDNSYVKSASEKLAGFHRRLPDNSTQPWQISRIDDVSRQKDSHSCGVRAIVDVMLRTWGAETTSDIDVNIARYALYCAVSDPKFNTFPNTIPDPPSEPSIGSATGIEEMMQQAATIAEKLKQYQSDLHAHHDSLILMQQTAERLERVAREASNIYPDLEAVHIEAFIIASLEYEGVSKHAFQEILNTGATMRAVASAAAKVADASDRLSAPERAFVEKLKQIEAKPPLSMKRVEKMLKEHKITGLAFTQMIEGLVGVRGRIVVSKEESARLMGRLK